VYITQVCSGRYVTELLPVGYMVTITSIIAITTTIATSSSPSSSSPQYHHHQQVGNLSEHARRKSIWRHILGVFREFIWF
jgi:hypothetical protein